MVVTEVGVQSKAKHREVESKEEIALGGEWVSQ
jgi:hypothetical protein